MNHHLSVNRRGVLKAGLGAAWFGPAEGKSRVVISRGPSLRASGPTPDSRSGGSASGDGHSFYANSRGRLERTNDAL